VAAFHPADAGNTYQYHTSGLVLRARLTFIIGTYTYGMPPQIENETQVKNVMNQALRYARQRVEYADLLYEKIVRIEIQQLPDRLLQKPFNIKARVQLRLLEQGKKVEIKVGTLNPDSLKDAIDTGVRLLKLSPTPPQPVRLAPIPNPEKIRYGTAAPRLLPAGAIFTSLLKDINKIARVLERKNPGMEIKPEFWFFSQREEKAIADSTGVFKTQVMPRTFLQLVTRVKGLGGKMTQTRARLGNPLPYSFIVRKTKNTYHLTPEAARHIRSWMEKTVELQKAITLNAEEIKSLTHFVLHFTTLGVFVHEALGHNFEADIVKAGSSGIIDQEGYPRGIVAAENVNILDGPLPGNPRDGFGTEFIDDEGVEVKTKLLAENGVIKGMIHNRETAAYFNAEPNGGAFSELGDQRIPRMSNTFVQPATRKNWFRTLDKLIADIPKGLILEGTSGGAVSKDGMSSSVLIGYLIENGRITRTVQPANFSAQTLHALRYVEGFAGPVRIDDVGFCGKGQTKYVGDGGPVWTRIRNNEFVNLSIQG
jgi:predicted Zn-dependent protease